MPEEIKEIEAKRALNGKPQNQYLVLNLEDGIELEYLSERLSEIEYVQKGVVKVKDIAVALVNATLKAKGD